MSEMEVHSVLQHCSFRIRSLTISIYDIERKLHEKNTFYVFLFGI